MTKTFVAHTYEMNDTELAVSQIKEQLKLNENLLQNSIGVVSCHHEFVLSGVTKAVGEALPFDVIGAVSTAQSDGENADAKLFTIMLITSDTVDFVNVVTTSLEKNPDKAITECYKEAAIGRYGRPSLILTYAPFIIQNSVDDYVASLSKASYGAPLFGTVAMGDISDFAHFYTIFNGEHYPDKIVMSLFFGSVRPKFYIANISIDNLVGDGAKISKSRGPVIMEINERPVFEFLQERDFINENGTMVSMDSYPFFVDYHDNTPMVARTIHNLTPERFIMCGGTIPENSTIFVATNEKDDMLKTTGSALESIVADAENACGLIIYSCLSRFLAMGETPFDEMQLVNSKINGKFPMLMATAGGEICQTTTLNEKSINRFHNNTFIACLF
ncbi:MAG: FIST C-terminal domain-containing protein [Clostridiales bacterium]|jgi:hypothetical protein|nr:FIST C-terminal domain-containing protein [Clostridiales bacterium]